MFFASAAGYELINHKLLLAFLFIRSSNNYIKVERVKYNNNSVNS